MKRGTGSPLLDTALLSAAWVGAIAGANHASMINESKVIIGVLIFFEVLNRRLIGHRVWLNGRLRIVWRAAYPSTMLPYPSASAAKPLAASRNDENSWVSVST